jgi:hypothetical protein
MRLPVPARVDGESLSLQDLAEPVHRETIGALDPGVVGHGVVVELAADLVKFADDLVDDAKPIRGQEDREFRPFAIYFQQANPAPAIRSGVAEDIVKGEARYGFGPTEVITPEDETTAAGIGAIPRVKERQ